MSMALNGSVRHLIVLLLRLRCPSLAIGVSDEWLRQLLQQPSEHRTALLLWCLQRLDPAATPTAGAQEELVCQQLVRLGLVRAADVRRFITGPLTSRGVAVWNLLLQLVARVAPSGAADDSRENGGPVSWQEERRLLNDLCCAAELQQVLRPDSPELIPADIRMDMSRSPAAISPDLLHVKRIELKQLEDRLADVMSQGSAVDLPLVVVGQLTELQRQCADVCRNLESLVGAVRKLKPRLDSNPAPPTPSALAARVGQLISESAVMYDRIEKTMNAVATLTERKSAPPPPAVRPAGHCQKLVSMACRFTKDL